MSKPILVFQGPVSSRSGYGDHARDILKSIFEYDKFDVRIVPTNWGTTPQNQLDTSTDFGKRVLSSVVRQLDKKPEVFIQLSVANEFRPIGEYNIGITAGVETTIAPDKFIQGCNQMDLIIVPSEFTKETLETTSYTQMDKRTRQPVGELKIHKPIEVVFEGVNLDVFNSKSKDTEILDDLPTDFNFLFVGHWLQGDVGQDRKDVGMMIRTFCTVFKNTPKKNQPGLVLKTSSAGFSIGNKTEIQRRIEDITKDFGDTCPPVYLLFGDLTETDLNEVYNHPKIKSMVMFTKGEGYGRPLAEFATTGKPIVVSKWSGHRDFLPEEHTEYLEGELTDVHKSAQNEFLIQGSKWFTVNYSVAAQKLNYVFTNYKNALQTSNGLKVNIRKNFSMKKMNEKFAEVFDKNIQIKEHVPMVLPELPTLKKV